MTLEQTLSQSVKSLNSGFLKNEAEVRSAVISPILSALGWDEKDPRQRRPEQKTDAGIVDEVLFGVGDRSLVFLEAKRHGNLSPDAEKRLFEYAFQKGVPILVLTDGDTWDLYLSWAEGEASERRFAHVVLTKEKDLGAASEVLRTYLGKDAVRSGEAKRLAGERLEAEFLRKLARAVLAPAWRRVLSRPSDAVAVALAAEVEAEVGEPPDPNDVIEFLRNQATSTAPTGSPPPTAKPTVPRPAPSEERKGKSKVPVFFLRGKRFQEESGSAALCKLASELQRINSSFLINWAEYKPFGKGKLPRAVRQDHPVLSTKERGRYRQIDEIQEWWLKVNLNNEHKPDYMYQMAECARLTDADRFAALIEED